MPLIQLAEYCPDETQPVTVDHPGTAANLPADPWGANLDRVGSGTIGSPSVNDLALGPNITQTPEYQAANLPPYNGNSLLSFFLL